MTVCALKSWNAAACARIEITDEGDEDMKKKLMGLIICLIGFGMGFLSLLYSNEAVQSLEECTRKVVNPSIKDKKDWIFSSIGNIGTVGFDAVLCDQ